MILNRTYRFLSTNRLQCLTIVLKLDEFPPLAAISVQCNRVSVGTRKGRAGELSHLATAFAGHLSARDNSNIEAESQGTLLSEIF